MIEELERKSKVYLKISGDRTSREKNIFVSSRPKRRDYIARFAPIRAKFHQVQRSKMESSDYRIPLFFSWPSVGQPNDRIPTRNWRVHSRDYDTRVRMQCSN